MAKQTIHITARLKFIENFLDHLEREVRSEWSEIVERRKQGKCFDYSEYEAAMDFPLFREQFSTRAVVNELNGMAEEVLQTMAEPAYHEKQNKINKENISKPIWELPIGKVWELIEDHYKIRREDIPEWKVYDELREMVNSFKHGRGFRRLSDILEKGVIDSDIQHQATFKNARQFLNAIKPFLLSVSALKPKTVIFQQQSSR